MSTKQEIFDKVINGLVSQNLQQSHLNDRCMYRGPNGLKCAAGHLIPDEIYEPAMEGNRIGYVVKKYKMLQDIDYFVDNEILNMITDLQIWHDISPIRLDSLKKIAETHNVIIPQSYYDEFKNL
jgi:hypothetical protein